MNYLRICWFVLIAFALSRNASGQGFISVNYSASASGEGPVTQSAVIQPTLQDFIALGPDSIPLFDVSFGAGQISITALRAFAIGPNGFMDFTWDFAWTPASDLSFDSANLVSSSLFAIPPFTFPVNPPVSFDAASHSISVGGFIADGIGSGVVNNGGLAVIDFIVVPEPPAWILLALGTTAMFLFASKSVPMTKNILIRTKGSKFNLRCCCIF